MLATINPKLLAWLWLVLAIITEVLGSSFLKIAQTMSYGFLVTAFFICVSYYFIGLAIKRISVSVAYAMWEVLGVVCIVIIGIMAFDEQLSLMQYAGIACAIVGIMLINFGEVDSNHTESNALDSSTITHAHNSQPAMSSFVMFSIGLVIVVGAAFIGYVFNDVLLGFFLVCVAAVLDVIANLLLKASNGFSKISYGIGAVAVVIAAFYLLMLALDSMELAVAYSSWGAIGIIGTITGGRILFNEQLNNIGYTGVVLVIAAVGLLHEII